MGEIPAVARPATGPRKIVVAGGGAAGFFAAIACAETDPTCVVTICEATAHPLAKVRVSGGGRCNVTHACFDPRELVRRYPRGSRELLGAFHRWQPRDTVAWFEARGVTLKTEDDGRMFPVTDDSRTIVDCLQHAAEKAGVRLLTGVGVRGVVARAGTPARKIEAAEAGESAGEKEAASASGISAGGANGEFRFLVTLTNGDTIACDRLLLATGGNKSNAGFAIAQQLGHTIVPPVPSLFTFHIDDPRLKELPGVSVPDAVTAIPGTPLKERGPLLVTHWGLSGPAVLKLSAWGARRLHDCAYRFKLAVNWAPGFSADALRAGLEQARALHPKKQVASWCPFSLPLRLWEKLLAAAAIPATQQWATVSGDRLRALATQVGAGEFAVNGKSMFKEEFVTCGGVQLSEVDFKTMESRLVPGLHFAGEVLDIDGITGGFNFQAAWTGGWLAGRAMGGAAE